MSTYDKIDLSQGKYILRCAYDNCKSRIIKINKINEHERVKVKNHELVYDMLYISPDDNSIIAHPESGGNDDDDVREYFVIQSMWDFDNIGVSKTKKEFNPDSKEFDLSLISDSNSGKIRFDRYLICSDCNRGPIGFAGFIHDEEGESESKSRDDVVDLQKYVKERTDNNNSLDDLRYFISCNSVIYNE